MKWNKTLIAIAVVIIISALAYAAAFRTSLHIMPVEYDKTEHGDYNFTYENQIMTDANNVSVKFYLNFTGNSSDNFSMGLPPGFVEFISINLVVYDYVNNYTKTENVSLQDGKLKFAHEYMSNASYWFNFSLKPPEVVNETFVTSLEAYEKNFTVHSPNTFKNVTAEVEVTLGFANYTLLFLNAPGQWEDKTLPFHLKVNGSKATFHGFNTSTLNFNIKGSGQSQSGSTTTTATTRATPRAINFQSVNIIASVTSIEEKLKKGESKEIAIVISNKGITTARGLSIQSHSPLFITLAGGVQMFDLGAGAQRAFYLLLNPGKDVEPGIYYSKITVTGSKKDIIIPIQVVVDEEKSIVEAASAPGIAVEQKSKTEDASVKEVQQPLPVVDDKKLTGRASGLRGMKILISTKAIFYTLIAFLLIVAVFKLVHRHKT